MSESIEIKETIVQVENISLSAFFNYFDSFEPKSKKTLDKIISDTFHEHSYTELFLCYDKEIVIRTEEKDICLNPGDLLMVPPKFRHVMLPHKARGISIGFSYSQKRNESNHDLYKQLEHLYSTDSPIILGHNLSYETERVTNASCEILKVLRLLELLLTLAEKKDSKNKAAVEYCSEKDIGRISTLEILFATSFMHELRAEDVAENLHISKRQLDRIIHRAYGLSFREVLMKYRINTACRMLRESNLPAEDIGYAVGYNNKSAFYSAFRKIHGMTPIQFRNQNTL